MQPCSRGQPPGAGDRRLGQGTATRGREVQGHCTPRDHDLTPHIHISSTTFCLLGVDTGFSNRVQEVVAVKEKKKKKSTTDLIQVKNFIHRNSGKAPTQQEVLSKNHISEKGFRSRTYEELRNNQGHVRQPTLKMGKKCQ